jgi:hypothetical protein
MSFSVTGNLLTGSKQRPDITTIAIVKPGIRNIRSDSSMLNCLGYLPVISTISGLSRALLGTVHTIGHLACAIFSKHKEHHLQEAKLGLKNIGRGLIEAIPIIGNITMLIIDIQRTSIFENMVKNQIEMNHSYYDNHVTKFAWGKEIKRLPLE